VEITKSTRFAKAIGTFGENVVCNWLSRSGFEVALIDYTGIDLVAYRPRTGKRLGITVKSRTRREGLETDPVNLFFGKKNDRQKVKDACKFFACEPWIAVYIESTGQADIYLTSLKNYEAKYRRPGNKIDDWKMSLRSRTQYASDHAVRHIHITFEERRWTW
jgi:hypothetical protein